MGRPETFADRRYSEAPQWRSLGWSYNRRWLWCLTVVALLVGWLPHDPSATATGNGITVIQGAPNHIIEVDCSTVQGFNRYFVPWTITDNATYDSLQVKGLSTCNSKSHGRYNSQIGPSTTCGGGSFTTFCGAGLYNLGPSAPAVMDYASLYRNTRYQLYTDASQGVIEIIFYFALDKRFPAGVWTPTTQTVAGAVGSSIASTLAYSIDGSVMPTFSISPALPAGLTIDPTTGVISGTPTTTHPTTTHTVTATMGSDAPTATVTISIGTHRVGFHANAPTSPYVTSGTVPAAIFATNDGDSITLPPGPTRPNHGFNGWFTSATDAATKVGDAGDSYTPTGSITLYAQWTAPYVVTYNSQGGSSRTASSVSPGAPVTLPTNPTRSALTFAGWYDAASGGDYIGTSGDPFTPTESTTLYAQWTAKITYSLGSGSLPTGSPTSVTVNINTDPTSITLPTPTRTGYRFTGWWSASSGGTKFGDAGDSFTVTENDTLYARWLSLTRVDFDLRGGAISDQRCQMLSGQCRIWWGTGDPAFILPDVTSSGGLTFDGWYTSSSGGTRRGGAGDTLANPVLETLRAQWSGTRTFDPNGGSVSVPSVTAKTGTYPTISRPYRPGHAFMHWQRPNSTAVDRQRTSFLLEATETWTAQWQQFPDAPALERAWLSQDRTTITLQFDSDVQAIYGSNPSCSEFSIVSTPKDADFDDKATGRTCTIDGSTIEITRTVADDALPIDTTSLTLAYTGISLASAGDSTELVHHTAPAAVQMPPSAPTSLVVTPVDGGIEIAFSAGSDGESPITNYEYTLDGGDTWVGLLPAASASPITVPGLDNGTQYTVAIRAINAIGHSPPSAQATATPVAVPAAPTGLTATAGDGEVEVTFTLGDDGGSPITDIEYTIDGGTSWTGFDPADTTSPVTITGLDNGTGYTIALRAINANGPSTPSASVQATPSGLPAAPTELAAAAGDSEVEIAFTTGSANGSAITNYEYTIDDGTTWTALDPADTTSPVTITGLTNGTGYTIALRATNANGPGVASAPVAVTPSVPESPPETTVPDDTPIETETDTNLTAETTATEPVTPDPPAPAPVPRPEGDLPDIDPGQAFVMIDGVPTEVTTEIVDETTVRVTSGSSTLGVAGVTADGKPKKVDSDGRLTVDEGGLVEVSGSGFSPGTVVDLWVFSNPRYLGSVTVGTDGTFTGRLPLPADLPPGDHTVQANGTTAEGVQMSASLGLLVKATGTLPTTGRDDRLAAWFVLLAAAGGLVALASGRRTQLRV